MKAYYTNGSLLLLNIALCLGTFIQVLDTSIANVAIPYIAGNLSVSVDEGTWVITSFAVSNAIVLPLTGWLSDYFGRIRLFVGSIFLFSMFSFLCGFSTSLTMLVICRVFQGGVAGCLIPLSQSILFASNPPEKQGSAFGFWGAVVVIAPLLGPIVGGYLTEVYSWPWIFYINVPIGLFSAFITWYYLKDRESEIVRNPIDWVGLVLLSLGVASVQIMLDKGKDLDWFESNLIISLTIISFVTFSYFTIWTYFEKHPIVDFSFLRDRNFFIGTILLTTAYLLYFSGTVTLPLWLQTQQGYTAFWAGIAIAPIGIISLMVSSTLGKNLNRLDLRWVVGFSFLCFSLSFFYQSNFTPQVNLGVVMYTRFLQGFGIAFLFIPLVQLALGNIPKSQYAKAAGLFHFIRILIGSGFGTSLSIELWNRLEIFHHARLSETINIYRPSTHQFYEFLSQASSLFSTEVINRLIDQLLTEQAFTLSTNDLSWLAGWLFLLLIPFLFLFQPLKKQEPSQPGELSHA